MNREQIESCLDRVFLHHWDYSDGEQRYFMAKEQGVRGFAHSLGDRLSLAPIVEMPMNLQNFYRIEACLDKEVKQSRYAVSYDLVETHEEIQYIEVICSVILPVSEARWHRYKTAPNGEFIHEAFGLLEQSWLSTQPKYDQIATEILCLGEKYQFMVLDDSILSAEANPSWPVPFPGNPQPTLRDFIFPGVLD